MTTTPSQGWTSVFLMFAFQHQSQPYPAVSTSPTGRQIFQKLRSDLALPRLLLDPRRKSQLLALTLESLREVVPSKPCSPRLLTTLHPDQTQHSIHPAARSWALTAAQSNLSGGNMAVYFFFPHILIPTESISDSCPPPGTPTPSFSLADLRPLVLEES